ncbi:MAG: hypothetical protein Q4F41_06520 [Eubacteriales bacterium]|nr:hypothetical protein [Eubacteriales bacterium]
MKHLIFSNDPYEMNWLRPDFTYAEVSAPKELEAQVTTEQDGDVVRTVIVLTNRGKKPYFTNRESISIAFPVQDRYEDSDTCLKRRCHTHIFCGGEVSYLCALRMGGEAPHLGMVLTEGSLGSYSIRRNLLHQSNDRGCFLLHPEGAQYAPGESKRISWTIFPHAGKEDFMEKIPQYNPRFIRVEADQYVLFPGEKNRIHICPAFPARRVTVDGEDVVRTDGEYIVEYTAEMPGERVFSICADGVKTSLKTFVQEKVEILAARRCAFLAEHQQYKGEGGLAGAYLAYDNEEERLVYTPENDFNGGRERIGMGILMARYLQAQQPGSCPALESSLETYTAYVLRELTNPETGQVFNDFGRDDSYRRLYNAPWAATFFVEMYRLKKEVRWLTYACRVVEWFYRAGGESFYPIELPVIALDECLDAAGLSEERARMRELFVKHAERLCAIGVHYPAHEVNYEQSIVAPAADILLSVYKLTGEERFLTEGKRQVEILELFNGMQPDYHLYETAIRHWDGYWFGKRRLFGDTFPHYWSALTGNVFALYGSITGDETYKRRAEASRRGVLSLFFPDGRAACAYVYPDDVNGVRAGMADPYANDQDWGLYFYLRSHGAEGLM